MWTPRYSDAQELDFGVISRYPSRATNDGNAEIQLLVIIYCKKKKYLQRVAHRVRTQFRCAASGDQGGAHWEVFTEHIQLIRIQIIGVIVREGGKQQ